MAFTETPITANTNNTTRVEVVPAPSSGRHVTGTIVILNRDTVSGTFTLEYKDNATYYVLATATLDSGDSFNYDVPVTLDDNNDSITVVLSGAITTNQWAVTGSYAVVT